MAKAKFMSMRWLRLHLKEIIWGTVILFVFSCFLIGYGTSRAIKHEEERRRKIEEAEKKLKEKEQDQISPELKAKLDLPAINISLPYSNNASVSTSITLRTIYNILKLRPEYTKLQNLSSSIRNSFISQLKEAVIKALVMEQLLSLYAQAYNIKPNTSPQALVELYQKKFKPAEFNRQMHEWGFESIKDFGERLYLEEVKRLVQQQVTKPIPLASATEEFLLNYYQQNKVRFKQDDEITLKHLLISPEDFIGKTSISDDEIKNYYDQNRSKFVSSKRASVRHIMIKPEDPEYLKDIIVNEKEIKQKYLENKDKYKESEQVLAKHILIKPKNYFEKELDTFSLAMSNFKLENKDNWKFSFDINISKIKPNINLKEGDIKLVLSNGTQAKLGSTTIKFPIIGQPNETISGTLEFVYSTSNVASISEIFPVKLEIKDASSLHEFDVSYSYSQEKAYEGALKIAKDLLAKLIEKPDLFDELAKTYSEDIATSKEGGNLGYFTRGQMVKPFEDAAFNAKIGEIVGPIKTNFGYHLIKVENKKPERIKPIEEVRNKIIEELKIEKAYAKAENELELVRDLLIRNKKSFEELAQKHSMAESKKNGGKLPIFFKGEITDDYTPDQKKILLDEISEYNRIIPEIEEAVFSLQPNEVSNIIKTQVLNSQNKYETRYHLFKLEELLEPIQLSFTEHVKYEIKEILEKENRLKLAETKAQEFATAVSPTNFEDLASNSLELKVSSFTLPFSTNPSFSSYEMSQAIGQLSYDGFTWILPIHKALVEYLPKDQNQKLEPKVIGPIQSELGFHFIQVIDYKTNRYKPFEEIKGKLKQMLTQIPTDEEIKEEFEKNKDKFEQPAKRKIRKIVTTTLEKAEEVYNALKAGEMFSLLAKKYSIDSSAASGGLVGEVTRGQYAPNVDDVIWSLKKGEYSKPIKTNYGYVIVMLEDDEKPPKKAELTQEIYKSIQEKLKRKYAEELLESFINGLFNTATIIRNNELLSLL